MSIHGALSTSPRGHSACYIGSDERWLITANYLDGVYGIWHLEEGVATVVWQRRRAWPDCEVRYCSQSGDDGKGVGCTKDKAYAQPVCCAAKGDGTIFTWGFNDGSCSVYTRG